MQQEPIVPGPVRAKARAAGSEGVAWLDGLGRSLQAWAARWDLTIGPSLAGGTEALAVEAMTADGRSAVLKLYPPTGEPARAELRTLQAAHGHAYADVYAADDEGRAVLLERLGTPLAELGLPEIRQQELLCETLGEAWRLRPPSHPYPDGAAKARELARFIASTWHELEHPCSAKVVETAGRYLEERRLAFDPRQAVLAHGDPHPWNALWVPGSRPARVKLIDPDSLFVERAYDLGVLMREWTESLLAGDPVEQGVARCRRLARLAGVDPRAVWQWGFAERTATALLCTKVGLEGAREMLAVAERWCAVSDDAV